MRRYDLTNNKKWQRQVQWKRQKTITIEEHPQRTISETCGLCDTGYISDNWEQQSEHSQWPLNKEWQGQHSQFLRCFQLYLTLRVPFDTLTPQLYRTTLPNTLKLLKWFPMSPRSGPDHSHALVRQLECQRVWICFKFLQCWPMYSSCK